VSFFSAQRSVSGSDARSFVGFDDGRVKAIASWGAGEENKTDKGSSFRSLIKRRGSIKERIK
jgi:hypothetical protein